MELNTDVPYTLRRIRDLAGNGAYDEAFRLAQQLFLEHPSDEVVAYERCSLIVDHFAPVEGLVAAKQFVKRFPTSFWGRVLLAAVDLRLNRGEAALKQLDAAVELGAAESQLRSMRIRALTLVGKKEEVFRLTASGTDLQSLRTRFELEQPKELSELDRSLDELERCGETPEYLCLYRSTWLIERCMYDEAEDNVKRTIEMHGSSVRLVYQLSNVEFLNGKQDSAFRRLEEILMEHPEDSEIRRSLAVLYKLSGKLGKSLRHMAILFYSVMKPDRRLKK